MIRLRLLWVMLLALAAVGLQAHPAYADTGTQIADCTWATLKTDLQAGGDWYYAPGQCPALVGASGTIIVTRDATLTALGNDVSLDGFLAGGQLFSIASGVSFGLTGLSLGNGAADDGGAIYNRGSVTIVNSSLSGNLAVFGGGAIYNTGTLIIRNSTFDSNFVDSNYNSEGNSLLADGGAIDNQGGTVTITGSTFSHNNTLCSSPNAPCQTQGGAIENTGTVTVANSTFVGDYVDFWGIDGAIGSGGAIDNLGTLTVTNSTLTGNSVVCSISSVECDVYGGAINNSGGATIASSTISGNTVCVVNAALSCVGDPGNSYDAGGVTNTGTAAVLNIGGTILANNTGQSCVNVFGSETMNDDGYNLVDDAGTGCGFSTASNDIVGSNPKLGPLADNGGPTQTMALGASSPALDAIPTSYDLPGTTTPLCSSTDQRGYTRPDDSETSCDIGAYEHSGPDQAPTTLSAVSGSGTYGGTVTLIATLTSGTTPVSGKTVSFTLNGIAVCGGSTGVTCPTTNSSGIATLNNVSVAGINAGTVAGAVGASFGGDSSYSNSTGTGDLTIAQASQTITLTTHAPSSAAYNSTFVVAATASSGLGITYGSSGSCSNSGATFTMTSGSGTCTVTYDQAGNGNYNGAKEVTETVTAQKANQTITFGALANHAYGDAPFTVTATASSGLAVSFSASGNCIVSGNAVTLTGSGSCTVTASQPGDGNDNPAQSVSQSFSIAKAGTTTSLTSSATPSILKQGVTFTVTVTSGDGIPGGTVTLKDGTTTLASGITLGATGSAAFTTSTLSAGTHSITASYSGNANYNSSASGTVSQQVRYKVKVLSTSSLTIELQLLDYTGANVSTSTLTVTAECVVAFTATAPTTCGSSPIQTINKPFSFNLNWQKMGPAYQYMLSGKGLTKRQSYYLLVQTDGDPIWHAVPFTA